MKNPLKTTTLALCLFSVFFLVPETYTHAQLSIFDSSETPEGELRLSISPQHPRPGNNIAAKLSSPRHDLERSKISWYENGVLAGSEDGLKIFSFLVPASGNTLEVSATVLTPDNQTLSISKTIKPASVTLVWEAESSVPPFYKGKALLPPQGEVRVVAIPNIPGSLSNKLVYTWKKDGTILGSLSGLNRNFLDIDLSVTDRSLFIVVEVESQGGIVAQQGLMLNVTDPSTHFYEHSQTLGTLFNKSISGLFNLRNNEIRLESYPYFLSNTSRGGVSYSWSVDDRSVAGGNLGEYLILQKGEGSGESSVSVEVDDLSKILQRASNSFVIQFEEDE